MLCVTSDLCGGNRIVWYKSQIQPHIDNRTIGFSNKSQAPWFVFCCFFHLVVSATWSIDVKSRWKTIDTYFLHRFEIVAVYHETSGSIPEIRAVDGVQKTMYREHKMITLAKCNETITLDWYKFSDHKFHIHIVHATKHFGYKRLLLWRLMTSIVDFSLSFAKPNRFICVFCSTIHAI